MTKNRQELAFFYFVSTEPNAFRWDDKWILGSNFGLPHKKSSNIKMHTRFYFLSPNITRVIALIQMANGIRYKDGDISVSTQFDA